MAVHFTLAGDFADCHLFLLHGVNDCFECFGVVYGEVGKNFAIEVDVFFLHPGDKLGVGKAEFARSIVNPRNPEGTKIAFFVSAVAVAVTKGFNHALFGEAETSSAIVLHTFGGSQGFLVFSMGRNATFDSHFLNS